MIKPLESIDLPEDQEIIIYIVEERVEEEEGSFFFPSAFDFWNDPREDLHSKKIGE